MRTCTIIFYNRSGANHRVQVVAPPHRLLRVISQCFYDGQGHQLRIPRGRILIHNVHGQVIFNQAACNLLPIVELEP